MKRKCLEGNRREDEEEDVSSYLIKIIQCNLKEEALARTVWKSSFGRGCRLSHDKLRKEECTELALSITVIELDL